MTKTASENYWTHRLVPDKLMVDVLVFWRGPRISESVKTIQIKSDSPLLQLRTVCLCVSHRDGLR